MPTELEIRAYIAEAHAAGMTVYDYARREALDFLDAPLPERNARARAHRDGSTANQ